MAIAMKNTPLKELEQLIVEIEYQFPLDYSTQTNQLFSKLENRLNSFEKLPRDIITRLQIIWEYRGFSIESHFAKQKNYQSFDFYPKYKKLMNFDTLFLRKMIGGKRYNKVIFVGSGALPLSLKLLRINIQKVGYDISKDALNLAKRAIPNDRFGRKIIYKEGNFFNLNLNEQKPIIIYIAGLIRGKEIGLKRVAKKLPKGSLMVVRTTANDSRGFLYEKVKKQPLYRIGKTKEFIPVKSSGVTNGMIVVKV